MSRRPPSCTRRQGLCPREPLPFRGYPGRRHPRGHRSLTSPVLHVFLPITDSEDDGESEAAKQLIQPIAEKIIAKYKAKEEEAPLLFFVAGEVSAAWARPGADL